MVAWLDIVLADFAGSELEYAVDFEADAGSAPWGQTLPGFDDSQVLIEGDDVDGEAHAEGMHAGRGLNEKAGAVVEGGFPEKADQSRKKGIRKTDAGTDGFGLLGNSNCQKLHRALPLRRVQAFC